LEQPPELVPDGAVFLHYVECSGDGEALQAVEGTVPIGTKLVFMAIVNTQWFDLDDDTGDDIEEPWCNGRDDPILSANIQGEIDFLSNSENYSVQPYAEVDGTSLEIIPCISHEVYYYEECPNDPTKVICDDCDITADDPTGCAPLKGTDIGPALGYYAADEREWKRGDVRTYSFGTTLGEGASAYCVEGKYTLRASGAASLTSIAGILALALSLWI